MIKTFFLKKINVKLAIFLNFVFLNNDFEFIVANNFKNTILKKL